MYDDEWKNLGEIEYDDPVEDADSEDVIEVSEADYKPTVLETGMPLSV